ncbi:hypothetical protein NPIL_586651 [Nephila pilipes]|uniref:Uncharacterized protein n=1 Tax=Nephila pilipes TaxID=299642 RepID=A0A8X6M6C5_NEPPI|nr:hypothetical protein NPIL_586651 [Nephila pilipes]
MFYGRKRRRGHSRPLMEHENANNSIPEVFMNWTQCINVKSLPWRVDCDNFLESSGSKVTGDQFSGQKAINPFPYSLLSSGKRMGGTSVSPAPSGVDEAQEQLGLCRSSRAAVVFSLHLHAVINFAQGIPRDLSLRKDLGLCFS